MIENKIKFIFNSHRTYDHFLRNKSLSTLTHHRKIDISNNILIKYQIKDLQVIIDRFSHVHISFDLRTISIDECLEKAKKEFLFLTNVCDLFDYYGPINIIIPKAGSNLIEFKQSNYNDLDSAYFNVIN